jgi:hypothetical protein
MRFKKCSSGAALFGFILLLLLGWAIPVRSRSLQASSSDAAIQKAWPRSGLAGRLLLNEGSAAVSGQESTQDMVCNATFLDLLFHRYRNSSQICWISDCRNKLTAAVLMLQ